MCYNYAERSETHTRNAYSSEESNDVLFPVSQSFGGGKDECPLPYVWIFFSDHTVIAVLRSWVYDMGVCLVRQGRTTVVLTKSHLSIAHTTPSSKARGKDGPQFQTWDKGDSESTQLGIQSIRYDLMATCDQYMGRGCIQDQAQLKEYPSVATMDVNAPAVYKFALYASKRTQTNTHLADIHSPPPSTSCEHQQTYQDLP